ncbi:MAG: peptidylprolyl isomerase [Odoribacter sp.]
MNYLGDQLYKPIQEEHRRYLMTGQKVKADSLIMAINKKIEKQFKMSPEVRGLYKSLGGAPFLDGDYTVFGEVIEGMDVIDQIAAVKVGPNDRPEKDVIILGTKLKRK